MTGRTAVRQEERRRVILAAARQLLRDQGWHAVAIDEIGAASGLTGPAVYRYFESKQALLTAALRHAAEELWSSVPDVDTPDLATLVDSHVRFVLDNADLVELWYTEARHLSAADRRDQRRLQRRYLERWVDALTARRPDLDRATAQTMVRAAVGLIHSVAHTGPATERRRKDRADGAGDKDRGDGAGDKDRSDGAGATDRGDAVDGGAPAGAPVRARTTLDPSVVRPLLVAMALAALDI